MSQKIRKEFRFYGWVQGVGFRYRARQAAQMTGCTGWVRNEYDGSVSMEIQGTEAQISQVIHAVTQGRFVDVEDVSVNMIPVVPGERGFHSW